MAKVTMVMDEKQAGIVMRACEFYSRVVCGQYNEIANAVMDGKIEEIYAESGQEKMHERFDELVKERDYAEEALKEARCIQFPELGYSSHYGYGYTKSTDLAFGAYQAIRYALAWYHHPEGGITVDFDKPFSPYPVPKVEVTE